MNPDKAKRMLRSIKDYLEDIKTADEELEKIWYELSGVKGIAFDKIRGTDFDEGKKIEHFEDKEKDMRRWEKQKSIAQANLSRVNDILKQLDDDIREAVIRIYCDDETYEVVANAIGYSISGLYARIERAFLQIR